MTHAYIPDAIREHRADHPEDRNIKMSAKIPKGSEVVVLESRSRQTAEATYRSLQQGVADRLIRDHQRTIDQIVKQYESDLSRAKIRLDELTDQRIFTVQEKLIQGEIDRGRGHLASLKDQAKLVEAEKKRLDETKKLLTQQATDVKAILATVSDRRTQAVSEVTDEARATTLLMLDSQIAESRARLGALEETVVYLAGKRTWDPTQAAGGYPARSGGAVGHDQRVWQQARKTPCGPRAGPRPSNNRPSTTSRSSSPVSALPRRSWPLRDRWIPWESGAPPSSHSTPCWA